MCLLKICWTQLQVMISIWPHSMIIPSFMACTCMDHSTNMSEHVMYIGIPYTPKQLCALGK